MTEGPAAREDVPEPGPETAEGALRRQVAQARRRRQVFGEVLDGATRDDRPEPGSVADGAAQGDRWLRDNVPPHHGG